MTSTPQEIEFAPWAAWQGQIMCPQQDEFTVAPPYSIVSRILTMVPFCIELCPCCYAAEPRDGR